MQTTSMFTTMTSILPLKKIATELYRYILKASPDGKYVAYDKNTSQYICGPSGILSSDPSNDEERGSPWLRIDDESDISARLGSSTPVYTMNVGIGYNDGSCGGLFVFEEGIIEYRQNIGKVTSKTFANRSAEIGYMVTYAGIGIKEERYDWATGYLEAAGIEVGDDEEKPYQRHNGYVWITSNITANTKPPLIIRDANGTASRGELLSSLNMVGKNLIGYLFCTMTLKRVNTATGVKHRIGLSLKGFQAVDTTDITSPPLNKVGTFNAVAGAPTSTALLAIFQGSTATASNPSANRAPIMSSVPQMNTANASIVPSAVGGASATSVVA
ncbi:UNVERIFIED_CONTAM: hypothetical protein HDU68_009360 [Siphonaria sp. JEL0065]|nr:hypothetical protein HDU68_009360 [Siphonaria sp. JEL0065]